MAQLLTLRLSRHDAQPWGFRLQGGKDFGTPLIVQKVNGGSISEHAGLIPGDAVIKINNVEVFNMRHKDAQDLIVRSGNSFDLTIQRGGSTWQPLITPVGALPTHSNLGNSMPTVTKTSLAHKPQEVHHIGSGYNSSARPFSSVNGSDGQVKSIVNKQYNSPVGIYSEEAIAETLSAQAEVLAGGVLGVNFKKNEKVYNSANSEVYKFLHEQESEPSEPDPPAPANFFWTASHAIGGRRSPGPKTPTSIASKDDERMGTPLQQNTLAPGALHRPSLPSSKPTIPTSNEPVEDNITKTTTDSVPTSKTIPGETSGVPTCHGCGVSIVGVFVRVKDKNLHVDCFKCATCGTSLKNQGYYNFNNKLYCDIHAKLAAMNNPPPGTEGYMPVPIKPNTKLSANTISAALSAHHHLPQQSNGTSNLIISPSSNVYQGYGGPKPFGAAPKTPPISGPRSPITYPPSSQAPSWAQPKPATNPYATLPKTGSSQEGECLEQSYEYHKEEEHHYDDLEVAQATRTSSTVGSVIWPPPLDENRLTPTATPLYIAPPETQHVKPKYVQKVENQKRHENADAHAVAVAEQKHQEQVYQQQEYYQQQQQQQQQLQWQSRSAPELTTVKQHVELESSSDSYTSTCTTTTTTSEEYQRMYQAQMQAYHQMQQMYEQSGSEIDYHMDMEVAAMQQQQEQSYSTSSEFLSLHSGRRSAQECAETISGPLSTYKLVDLVREVTPSPTPPAKGPRKVEFADDVNRKDEKEKSDGVLKKKETETKIESKEEKVEEKMVKIEENVPIERKFQPTPEIKVEIPEPMVVPPTNIPNPVPKEWISPMVKALTTAPDKPVAITEVCQSCPCKVPCAPNECACKSAQAKAQDADAKKTTETKADILCEEPPKGTFIAKVVSTAPTDPIKFAPKADEGVPLPEETEPYMPAPIDMKPYQREDFRPKSPLLRALITAPDRSFSPLGTGVCSQLDDLPRPKEKLTMVDALTVASNRSYTPLNPENVLNLNLEKTQQDTTSSAYKQLETIEQSTRKESIDSHMDHQISAFASYSGQRSTNSFQPKMEPIAPRSSQSAFDSSSALSKTCCRASGIQQSSQALQQQSLLQASSSVQQQQSMYQSNTSVQQYQQSTYQASSHQSMKQSQSHQSSSISTQQLSCSKSECQKSLESSQKMSFPPSPGPNAKKALISGLHKPDSIPQYQRNWTVLPSQRPVKTPEPPELRENVPLAFVDIPRTPSPVAVQPSASSKKSSTGAAVSDATRSSEAKHKAPTVPIIIEDRSGPITMTFQSIDTAPEQHEDHSQAHPRPFTPSLINKSAPIVPFYQTPDKLVFEECPATTSQPFDRRSVSPCPERAKSPAPGPPPNPLSAIRAPRIKEQELMPMRNTQTGSITTGQPYMGAQLMQQTSQQQGKLLSQYQAVSQTGSQRFVDKPEIVQQRTIGDMHIQTREKESQLNEEQRSQLESKTTTQVGNTQIERRRKVVEEYEHTQKAKTVEIRKTSGEVQQYGKTGFVANQSSRLSGLEREISNLTSQSQAISARAATLGPQETRFPQYKSPEPESKFPIKNFLPPYDESPKQPPFLYSSTAKQGPAVPSSCQTSKEQCTAAASSSYAASSISQSSATQSFLANSNLSSASNLAAAIPVPAFKPPMPSFAGDNTAQQLSQQPSGTNNTYRPTASAGPAGFKPPPMQQPSNTTPSANISHTTPASTGASKGGVFGATSAPKRGRGILNKAVGPGARIPLCGCCNAQVRGPFITALGRIWCPEHFICVNANCRRPLQDIGFVEEKGDLYCEYCFEKYLAPTCSKCNSKIKGDCLNAIGKHFHPECFTCSYCGKLFGNSPFFLEEGEPYCEADWNELFTTKCFACGFPVEAGDRWVEALNHNYHSQCFNCTMCKKNLEGQSFYNKGGRPFCKNHAR